jgi:hypothetical protein
MERSVMKKLLASIFGILLVTGLAIAEPPDGKGKEKTPGPVQVLANGESIGTFLQWSVNNSYRHIWAMSSTNYGFDIIANTTTAGWPSQQVGALNHLSLYYESPDCTSPAYVKTNEGRMISDTQFSVDQGLVFSVVTWETYLGLYYVPAGSVPAARQFQAAGPSCSPYYLANQLSVEAFPNDPTITGVPNASFTPPITLGH